MSIFIKDLENIVHKRFVDKKELEEYLTQYFLETVKINDFEGEIDFIEDNHLVGTVGNNYDIDIWYITDNEKRLYITEVAWEINETTQNEDLEFYDGLEEILNIYTDNEWENEPLDSDEVDRLVEILRNQLNLINGNITTKEYLKKGGK